MKLLLLTAALVSCLPRAAHPIAAGDVPSFRFSCTASNSLDTVHHAPLPPLPPPTNPPATPCTPACPKGGGEDGCVAGSCCTNVQSEGLLTCWQNSSSITTFVLGGQWYEPSKTWALNTSSAAGRWADWSAASFTAATVTAILHPGSVYNSFKTLGVQLGVRTSRHDKGILSISCAFQFLATTNHSSDAGKTAVITARMQNSNKTTGGWINDGSDAPASGYIGLMLGRDATGAPTVQTFAGFNRAQYYSKMGNIPKKPVKMAVLFPILDDFSSDADLTTKEEGFAALSRCVFSQSIVLLRSG